MKFLTQRLRGYGAALLAAASLSAVPASAEVTECEGKMEDLRLLISDYREEIEVLNNLNQRIVELDKQAYGCVKEKDKSCEDKFAKLEAKVKERKEERERLKGSLEKIKEDTSSVRGECQHEEKWHDFVKKYKIYSLPTLQID